MDVPAFTIRPDDLTGQEILDLLRAHLDDAARHSPPDSVHALAPDAYAPARALYARFGFTLCDRFADYRHDPYSTYMTLELAG